MQPSGLSGLVSVMDASDTASLVARARGGDAGAVEALVRHFLRPAYLVALSVVRNAAEAEDLAQESVASALQQLEACREPARFAGWLMAQVRNRSLNRLAASQVRQRHADSVQGVEAASGDAERVLERERLLRALEELSAQQREVVLLHDLEAWTHPEIAAALGVSEVNSRQILSTARRKLRASLLEMEAVS